MKKRTRQYIGIIIGALFISIGLYFFWAPSKLAAGGISGLSIVVKALLPSIPIGIIILILDIFMFAIGFLILGKAFGIRSIMCSLSVSAFMTLFEYVFPNQTPLSQDTLIILLFGSFFIAAGQGVVFNLEASSGGTDIIAKIITKFMNINIGVALMIADMIVVILASTIFGIEKGLYASLGVIVTSTLIDYIISGFTIQKYVTIIPSNEKNIDIINRYILDELERGATIYHAEGAYSKERKSVITTAVDRKQFIQLKNYIFELDKAAFVTVHNLHDVVGEGFEKA